MTIIKSITYFIMIYISSSLNILYSMPSTEEDTNPSQNRRFIIFDRLHANEEEQKKNAVAKEDVVKKDLKYKVLSSNKDEVKVELVNLRNPIRSELLRNFKPNDKLFSTYKKERLKLQERQIEFEVSGKLYNEEVEESNENQSPSLRKRTRRAEKHLGEATKFENKILTSINFFQVTVKGATYSKFEKNFEYPNGRVFDYYHLAQDGWFSPSEGLTQNKSCYCIGNWGLKKPILLSEYIMGAEPLILQKRAYKFKGLILHQTTYEPLSLSHDNAYDALHLIESSPETSQGTTEYTSGLEVSGAVTVGTLAGTPMGNINPSAKVTHTKTRNLEDVIIKNKSLMNGNKAIWVFKINNLERNLKKASPMSHSTFHPYVQWVWRVDREEAIQQRLYHLNPNDAKDEQYYFSFENYVQLQATFTRGCLWGLCCCGTNATKHSKSIPVIGKIVSIKIPTQDKILEKSMVYVWDEKEKMELEEYPIRGDGDCGYTSLGITRDNAAKLLEENAHRQEVRELVAPEIRDIFTELPLEMRHEEENPIHLYQLLLKEENIWDYEAQIAVTQINDLLNRPERSRLKIGKLIEQLSSLSSPNLKELCALNKLKDLEDNFDKLEKRKMEYCCREDTFREFITYFIKPASSTYYAKYKDYNWLNYSSVVMDGNYRTSSMDALAFLMGRNLVVLNPEGKLRHQRILPGFSKENTIFLLHIGNYHFNVLKQKTKEPPIAQAENDSCRVNLQLCWRTLKV